MKKTNVTAACCALIAPLALLSLLEKTCLPPPPDTEKWQFAPIMFLHLRGSGQSNTRGACR